MKFAARVKPSKAVLAITTTLLIFGAGSYLLGWSSLLTVKQIEITGAPTVKIRERDRKEFRSFYW
jgi:hypothetical protein